MLALPHYKVIVTLCNWIMEPICSDCPAAAFLRLLNAKGAHYYSLISAKTLLFHFKSFTNYYINLLMSLTPSFVINKQLW